MKSFNEKERRCEASFLSAGPYWHADTPGKETPLIFVTDEDFCFAMNVIAQAAALYPEIVIIAFEVMNNHFHFVLSCKESEVYEFWNFIRKRLSRIFPQLKDVAIKVRQIKDISDLRNNIIYTNRNGYVADYSHTPFSYPWGTGRFYFQPPVNGTPISRIKTDARRTMFRGRSPELPVDWVTIDNYIAPSSYCAISFGMAIFRDAHHYFNALTRNVEAYAGVAKDLGDDEFLTDTEVFEKIRMTLKENYGGVRLRELTKSQKLDLARSMRYEYRSSNGQIRRILDLSAFEIDSLFPLNKK